MKEFIKIATSTETNWKAVNDLLGVASKNVEHKQCTLAPPMRPWPAGSKPLPVCLWPSVALRAVSASKLPFATC